MDNHLILTIYKGLAVISLDDSVGGHHFGRVVAGNITLILSASGALVRLVLSQPSINQLRLPL